MDRRPQEPDGTMAKEYVRARSPPLLGKPGMQWSWHCAKVFEDCPGDRRWRRSWIGAEADFGPEQADTFGRDRYKDRKANRH